MRHIRHISPKNKLYFHMLLGGLLVVLVPLAVAITQHPSKALAAWYDDNWGFRKAVTVTVASSASDIRDLETLLTVDTTGITASLQTSCEDLRFTNQTGDILPYYAPSCSDNSATNKVWVLLDLVPKNTTTYTLYMYYGNAAAPTASDSQKFRLFNGLTAYWTLNESSGNRADSSVNSNTLTDNNTVTSATGKYSNAGQFTRANSEFLSITDNANVSFGDADYTLAAWVYADTLAAGEQTIMSTYVSTGAGREYMLETNAGIPRHLIYNSSGYLAGVNSSGGAISTSAWHLIVSYHDSANNLVGISVDGGAFDTADSVGAPQNSNDLFQISKNDIGNYWDGRIDDVRIYNRVLSASEVSQLYNSSPGNIASNANATVKPSTSFATEEKAPGPAAYWAFDEGTGTNAQDSTTNNLDGTLNNTPTWTTEDQCVSGKCLYFDGTSNENVSKADDSKLDFAAADNFTISAWAKRNGASSANNFIITKAQAGYTGYKLYQDASGDYCFDVSDGTNTDTACTSAVEFDDNSWHFVQGVKSGTTSITLYVDGRQRAQDATIAATGTLANTGTFYIGVDLDGTSNEWLGYIDEVKVYPYARTAAQVLADYNSRGSSKGDALRTQGVPLQNLSNGLVGYWKMDEASWTVNCSTGSVTDSSGNGNNGKSCPNSTGPAGGAVGKFGNAGSFDGTDDYISVADTSTLDLTTAVAISFWYKRSASGVQSFVGKWNATGNQKSYGLQVHTDDKIYFNVSGDGENQTYSQSTSAYTDTNWNHLVGVYNGSTLKAYLNGAEVAGTITGTVPSSIYNSTSAFENRYNAANYYSGTLDELRLYNRALSSAEVSQLYNFAPGPVGYWNFEEGSGTSANDTSKNANAGTLGGDGAGTDLPSWSTGKYGKGLNYDGSDDFTQITDPGANSVLDMNGQITMSAWFKTSGSNDYSGIIEKSDGTAKGYQMGIHTGGNVRGDIFNGTEYSAVATTGLNLEDGKWHFMAVTYDGTTLRVYVDGVQQGSTSASGYLQSNSNDNSALLIGNDNCCGGRFFNGQIDEVKIYNYARSAKQITQDMMGDTSVIASAARQSQPIGYWAMNEGVDNTCSGGTNDTCNSGSGGSSLDGAGSGFASPATSTSGWTQAGKFGKALIFDGSNDYINAGKNSSLNFGTGAFSVSAWFKPTSGNQLTILAAKGTDAASNGFNLILENRYNSNQNAIGFTVSSATTNTYYTERSATTAQYTAGSWNHTVGVWDKDSNLIRIYLNGIPTAASIVMNSGTESQITTTDNTNRDLLIGAYDTGTSLFYNGTIDEVKIYNYALTADEVKLDMNRGKVLQMSALGDNTTAGQVRAASQQYCIPGDSSTCTAPVGEWDFNEGQGTSVNDTSGNANIGTWNGTGSHWTTGKYGKAGNFNGTDDYVSITDSLNLGDNDFTVSAWMNTTGGFLMSKRNSDTVIEWNINATTTPIFSIFTSAGGSAGVVTSSESITTGQWHYITAVNDETNNQIKIYINGRLAGTTTKTGAITDSVSPFRIGAIGSTPSNFFTGKVDGVRIYNYARSAAQIAWDYNRGDPVGWWRFDECQGDTTYDNSGNGNTGTITIGGSGEDTIGTCNTSSTAWGSGATGKRNSSLSFDGTDDYAQIPDSNSLDLTNLTVSAWIYIAGGSGSRAIAAKGNTSSSSGQNYLFYITSGRILEAQLGNGVTYQTITGTNALNTSAWYHVALTVDGTNVKFYINGNQDKSASQTVTPAVNAGALNIGYLGDNFWYFNGQIDEVKIFNYALTATQVKSLYNSGAVRFGPSTGSP